MGPLDPSLSLGAVRQPASTNLVPAITPPVRGYNRITTGYIPAPATLPPRQGSRNHRSLQGSPAVLLVADMLHPINDFAIHPLLNGDMRHGRRWHRPMPMLFTRREPHHITRVHLLDRTTLPLHPPTPR